MKIRISIEGTVGLILNRFTDEKAEEASSGSRGSSQAKEYGTPAEQAEKGLYIGLDGKPCIPQPNLLRCIVDGGRFHKVGKTQVTTTKSSILYGCLDIEGADLPLLHREPWRVDTRAVRIPSTGGRVLRHRPCFDDWRISFTADLDTSVIGPKLLRQIVDDAGKRIGLGDFRPATKGPYGRFVVTEWRVLDDEELAEAA